MIGSFRGNHRDEKEMKILQVSHRFPPHPGGVEYHVQRLSKFLASRGHEVTVLTTSRELSGRAVEDGYEVYRFRSIAEPLRNPLSLKLPLKFRHLADDSDIVHMHSVYTFTTLLSYPFSPKERTLITLHGRAIYSGFYSLIAALYERISFRLVRNAASFIALTDLDRDLMVRRGIQEEKVVVIPNFVDVNELDSLASRSRVAEKEAEIQLLFVGGLVEAKGLDRFLLDMRMLEEDVGLWIVGDGPMRSKLERISKGMNVRFLGSLSREEWVPYALGSDAMVLPSRSEGFPTVALEAMALGRPLILSDIGVHRRLFRDAAILYRPGRPDSLKMALKMLDSSGNLVKEGRRIVEEVYDVRVVGEEILELYRRLRGE